MSIRIRFDGPPGPEGGRFVEVENEFGKSIKVGEWVEEGADWVLVLNLDNLKLEARVRELETELEQRAQVTKRWNCTPAERAVLGAIENEQKRLGDDPPYYHVESHSVFGRRIADAINSWLGAAPVGGYGRG